MLHSQSTTDTAHDMDRLKILAASDPVSAELIKGSLSSARNTFNKPGSSKARRKVQVWLDSFGDEPLPEYVITMGAGTNGTVDALDDLLPESSCIILMEKDPASAASLFKRCEIEKHVSSGRLRLALGTDREYLYEAITKDIKIEDIAMIKVYDRVDCDKDSFEFYTGLLHDICDDMRLNVFGMGTLLHWGLLWQYNVIKNLPLLLTNPGLAELRNAFEGKPALIVGAGPSIEDALPHLKECVNGYVVLSACTALSPLRKAGIRPDLAVAVDASKKTGRQFEAKCDDLFLASSSVANPEPLKKFRGLFSGCVTGNPVGGWMDTLGMRIGHIAAAGTVTACAIDIARQMGCNPIVTIGCDLSFLDDGTTHAKDTMYDGEKSDIATLVTTPGNYKPEVLTSKQMKCYVKIMENYVSDSPETTYYNATNGGARIEGMKLVPPEELLSLRDKEDIDAYEKIAEIHSSYSKFDRNKAVGELEKIIEQLDLNITDAAGAAMVCNRLLCMLKRPRPGDEEIAKGFLDELKEIDEKIECRKESCALIDMSLRPISFQMNSGLGQNDEHQSEAVSANRHSRDFYEQVGGASRWTRKLLAETCEILSKVKEEENDHA